MSRRVAPTVPAVLAIVALVAVVAVLFFRRDLATLLSPGVCASSRANILFTNERRDELTNTLSSLDADVVVLQEWTGANADRDEFSRRGYTLRADAPRQGTAGSCLFSRGRYEVVAATVASPIDGPCAMPLVTARVRLGARWLSVIGVHAPPPIASCKDGNRRFLAAIAGWIDAGKLRIDIGAARAGDPCCSWEISTPVPVRRPSRLSARPVCATPRPDFTCARRRRGIPRGGCRPCYGWITSCMVTTSGVMALARSRYRVRIIAQSWPISAGTNRRNRSSRTGIECPPSHVPPAAGPGGAL